MAVSPFASSSPDGLNRVAAQKAFAREGRPLSIQDDSPIPGYSFPGIHDETLAKGVAGFTGTLGVFVLGYGLAFVIRRRHPERGGHVRAV
jgi:hypothetical protein